MKVPPIAAQTPAPTPAPFIHPVYPTGASSPLGQQIAALLSDPAVSRAHWGIAVTALDGTPIYGLDEGKFFRPASNAKLYTTVTAMTLLGPTSTVETTLDSTGTLAADGTLTGNLTLTGAGDGNFSGRPLPYRTSADQKRSGEPMPDPLRYIDAFAASVAAAGVNHITGDIVGDDSLWRWEPYPGSWSIDDMVGYDGSPVSALTIDDNALDITVTPGSAPGQPATAMFTPEVGFYQLRVDVKTVAAKTETHIRIDREVGSKTLLVFGTIAAGKPYTDSIAITDPAEFAALALKQKLQQHGVHVDGISRAKHLLDTSATGYMTQVMRKDDPVISPPPAIYSGSPSATGPSKPIHFTHLSSPLSDDITVTLKVSQNLHAELLLRRLFYAGGVGYSAQGAHIERDFLIKSGLDGDDFIFYDGSGLSSHDLVTPRTTAQLLTFASTQPWFAQWKAALPVSGVDGTLASRFPDAPLKGHIYAKTGTLGESRGLTGYLDCASGRQVIFSIFADDHTPAAPADRIAMDKIVAAIAANE